MAGKAATARANGRKGGRPKGSKSAATLEREAVAAAFRQRVFKQADRLFNAQLALAEGCSFVFRVEPPKKKGDKEKHELVTDPEEIKAFLDGDDDGAYRYISTKEPNNYALADMLNRALGKPTEVHEISGTDGRPIQIVNAVRR